MSRTPAEREVELLAFRASEQELTADESHRVSELLQHSDAACRTFLYASMLDADLAFLLHAEAAEDRAMDMILRMDGPQSAEPTSAPRRVWFPLLMLSAAAALVVAATTLLLPAGAPVDQAAAPTPRPAEQPVAAAPSLPAEPILAQRQPAPVASLTASHAARFASSGRRVGEVFKEGERLDLDAGSVQVSMASGADFILTAPAAMEFLADDRVTLRRGRLQAQVAQWGAGFTVETAAMRITDLGTAFTVAASDQDVQAQVLEGQIRVEPLAGVGDGRKSLLLGQGEGLNVAASGDEAVRRVDAAAADGDVGEPRPTTIRPFRPFRRIELANTGVGLAEGDEDPHWRVTRGPRGGAFQGDQYAVVCVPDQRYAVNEPHRSQWISIARDVWPGVRPNSVFTFETTFDLTGFDLSTVKASAQLLADNGVREVRINGRKVPLQAWTDNQFKQQFVRAKFREVTFKQGFVAGVNRVEVDVWNGVVMANEKEPLDGTNPVALRVEWKAFGRQAPGEEEAAGRSAREAQEENRFSSRSPAGGFRRAATTWRREQNWHGRQA